MYVIRIGKLYYKTGGYFGKLTPLKSRAALFTKEDAARRALCLSFGAIPATIEPA